VVDVLVVGSVNRDLVVRVPRHPEAGETALASGHSTAHGGKGANQAVAAASAGATVAFVGRVGGDRVGQELLAGLAGAGVDVSRVVRDEEAPSGLAVVAVDAAGENRILVSPGANARVGDADVRAAASLLATASVLLLQLEIPIEAVVTAARLAQGRVVLNPAPARKLPDELLRRVDVLVPNRAELRALVGSDDPRAAAALGVPAVVVTLGAAGAALVRGGRVERIPAPTVEVVDTTGAGDVLCGTLAARLAHGASLEAAVRAAVTAASRAVGRPGAR